MSTELVDMQAEAARQRRQARLRTGARELWATVKVVAAFFLVCAVIGGGCGTMVGAYRGGA